MNRFPCPCCGYLVFGEGPGSDEICPICFWEDDALQLEFATDGGGANKVSLLEAQRNFASFGACEISAAAHVRAASEVDQRDVTWRPIDLTRDDFEDWNSDAARRAPRQGEALYYWRTTFSRNAVKRVIANIQLRRTEEGGRTQPILPSTFGCLVYFENVPELMEHAYDCQLFVGEHGHPIAPGTTVREIALVFLSSEEVVPHLKEGVTFTLWEGKPIGRGSVVRVDERK